MSRFVEILEEPRARDHVETFQVMLREMVEASGRGRPTSR